ncbi:MAG: radical SAM protein [Candidatus Brocadiales bacterium]|nr:radical SAM protein [Candidatus Bathyanammoxibius amoris]
MRKPGQIVFYAPGLKRYETEEFRQANPNNFLPVSITGKKCALDCEHCGGQLLGHMRAAATPEKLLETCRSAASTGTTGVLISGGCDVHGRVPLEEFFDVMGELKKGLGLRVFVHSGLVDEAQAEGLRRSSVDAVLIDIIGSNETIREVYHLEAGVEDYEASLRALSRREIPVMPHIVLGLHRGLFKGEDKALEFTSRYELKALVIVILTPLLGTAMADVTPPPVEAVGSFFQRARSKMPSTRIILGCARPMGRYKQTVDRLAIDAGLDGIAFPADGAAAYAHGKGLETVFAETCCGLDIPFSSA